MEGTGKNARDGVRVANGLLAQQRQTQAGLPYIAACMQSTFIMLCRLQLAV